MHFWNKLSTAALMRLTVLASLNLIMLRLVGRWEILLHPWFFLSMVTLDLGLYSVMVYSGALNKTLIGMMLGGLAATLGTLVYTGMGASAIANGGPLVRLGDFVMESAVNPALLALPRAHLLGRPAPALVLRVVAAGQFPDRCARPGRDRDGWCTRATLAGEIPWSGFAAAGSPRGRGDLSDPRVTAALVPPTFRF